MRRRPPTRWPAPAALLAFAAWQAGDGALAWCAVDRCLEADPDYSLAGLVAELLTAAVPPRVVGGDRCGLPARALSLRSDALAARPVRVPSVRAWAKRSTQQEFTRADRTRHREKVRRCLDVFARMLREARFDTDDPMTGLEIELNLVDDDGDPALKNAEALEAIADPDFQTELGQFNIEINVPPRQLREGGLTTFEDRPARAASTTPRARPPRSAPTW